MTLSTLLVRTPTELHLPPAAPPTPLAASGYTPREMPPVVSPPRSPSDGALLAIDEMLERFDTVTHAGRQHLMQKIVSLLVQHPSVTAEGSFLASHVDELRLQAGKAAPDADAFASATRRLLAAARRGE
jgi:hypothetical protein